MNSLSRRSFVRGMGGALLLSEFAQHYGFGEDSKPVKSGSKIRVGQIGVGHAHASKLEVYRRSEDYEVVGIVEPNEMLRKQAEAHPAYRDLKWMTKEQLLNVPELQAVLVETNVRDLLSTAEDCAAAGKHIHLDKPAGESFPQYTRLLATAARSNLMVQMGYMYRYNPAVILLRDFLKRGWIGDVFEIHTVMSKVVPPVDRKKLAEYPGGIMFELGCHVIDLVIGILGSPTKITPYAIHSSALEDTLLDNMLTVFQFPKATASVKSSALEVDGGERRHLVVCGRLGTFHIQPLDNPSAKITLSTQRDTFQKGYQTVTFPKFTRYEADAADMAKVIREEKPCDFPYDHDLTVQKAVLKSCGLPLDR